MSATDQDIRAIEYLTIRVRQDTHGCGPWDPHGVHVVFADHFRGMHLATAIGIAIAHAQDPEAKTPAAVKRPFAPEAPKPDGRQTPPRRAEECDLHPGQRASNCGGCAADSRCADGDPPPPRRIKPAPIPAEYHAARAALRDHTETEEES